MNNLTAVESIFLAALEKNTPEECSAFLDQACGPDAQLRQRVERLLSAHPKVGTFLRSRVPGLAATTEEQPITERPGTVIGPYKLMELIGEGGMGLVFVAEQQQPVRRKVALKVIKPGMDSREVIARFEAERQALALMEHPNIARVLDAGTTETGRPYFVMELVKGVPITDYCDANQLSPRQRLELFVPICQAVQHAHQKGIVHRDLKPSNILVCSHDGTPVVKVIDFGIAKAIGQQLSNLTIYTRFAQMIGTPLYMSPEQAGMSGLDVDTRSDIFSLGVLLYELLTGTTPFDFQKVKEAAVEEIRRIIREEDPPRPSTRLSTLGASLSDVSAKRRTEPRKLPALVRGDLDWIVMKALEKNRGRRYETASAFAADVRRFLNSEPIEARPPSVWYRFSKLARRNKVVLTTVALVAGALLLGTLVSTLLAVRAKSAEMQARAAAMEAMYQREMATEAAHQARTEGNRAQVARDSLLSALYDVEMSLLQPAWETDNLAQFDQLLNHQNPAPGETDLRTFEWYYWNRLRHADLRTVALAGSSQLGGPPVLSPNGKYVAAVAVQEGRGAVQVWDTTTGKIVQTLLEGLNFRHPLQAAPVRLAFSPDGRRLAVGLLALKVPDGLDLWMGTLTPGQLKESRREIQVWDTAAGRKVLTTSVSAFPGPFDSLAFSPDGRLLAIAVQAATDRKQPGRLHLWDVDQGKELSVRNETSVATSLAFSPDGTRLAATMVEARAQGGLVGTGSSAAGNKVQVWEPAGWKEVLVVQHPNQWQPRGVAFRPDGKQLAIVWAATKEKNLLAVYHAGNGMELRTFDGITGTHPVFSPDGERISCDSTGSLVQVWDVQNATVLRTARGHEKTPAVAFAADGKHLWTAGLNGTAKEWGLEPARSDLPPLPERLTQGSTSNVAYTFGKTGLGFARAFLNPKPEPSGLTIRVWDAGQARYQDPIEVQTDRPNPHVAHLVCNSDGARLAADFLLPGGTADKTPLALCVWDARLGQELFRTQVSRWTATALALSPDGQRIAWATQRRVRAWDVGTGRTLLDIEEPGVYLPFLAFSPDGTRLAWAGEQQLRVWNMAAGREVMHVSETGGFLGSLVFSPDGTRLAACVGRSGQFTEVRMWDTTGREVLSLKGEKSLSDLTFSPDGRRIVSLSRVDLNDQGGVEVKLWDALTGLLLLRLPCPGFEGSPYRLLFQPDGTRLFLLKANPSRAGENVVRQVWEAPRR